MIQMILLRLMKIITIITATATVTVTVTATVTVTVTVTETVKVTKIPWPNSSIVSWVQPEEYIPGTSQPEHTMF